MSNYRASYSAGQEREVVYAPWEARGMSKEEWELKYHETMKSAKEMGLDVSNPVAKQKQKDNYHKLKGVGLVEQGYDTRHWSLLISQGHLQLPHVPLEVKGLVLVLSSLMRARSKGKLVDGNLNPLNTLDIARKINKSEKTIRPLLRNAETLGLIKSSKLGNEYIYTLEPEYYICGKSTGLDDFVKVFQGKTLEISRNKKLNFSDLGILSVLINQMHYESHIICEDPTNPSYKEMKVWRPKDIAEKLNLDIQAVRRSLRKFNNEGITVEIKAYGIKTIILNPEMFSRHRLKIDMDILKEVANREKGNLTRNNYIN
ncbi:hypothetical protein RE438_22815 [Bacillus wiedmannii]|uniref:hypothetical protein n=1 Tax=Bacillus wiedmannii TaxID=1890302 RepID=UPI00065BAE89|nr:hypothetical protein [Bacillus wiedmannii]KMP73852.1 hypothetical protein TU62_19050 [Bacillus cereus]MCQ6541672.1 hypothetical protein [Bacillus wiedmannii]MCQ6571486.1 hypothetical protein [Bacillus wiedmannii]WMS81273.1 hypothetical protein RE438_22815 [Bacillus wiedmannii]HDR7672449.1 hypothetical protein [Bacillus wiedmannii]